ncbi:pyoverdine biosynthesis protein PvdJ [Acrocarpospora corrugata]|uniref:Pyoverdine biosynthesis protein PvdJ n=1 Tax=Acrocarpospora corrugata TaxID=35763 RepID=A0A5M3W327_9ACTN|nr:non-ribosomal peptide synthetase [Acrocarpospora corrugata]GES03164.1 pyoverdine biosynthesis protein PvdJ [Acrocarpospora corrugata]
MEAFSPAKQALLARLRRGAHPETVIPRVDSSGPFPLSYSQERVWFAEQLVPDMRSSNLVVAVRIPAVLDPADVERRLAALVAEHDVLRMSVEMIGETPGLVVADTVPIQVPVIDRSGYHGQDLDSMARQEALAISGRGYDLACAPLWRIELVRLPGAETMVVIAAHHLILDGTSLTLLGGALAGLLATPELPVRFVDFAAWQREQVEGGAFAAESDYWRRQLADLPARLELPADRRRPARVTFDGATISAPVPERTAQRVRAFAKETAATPYMVLLATFKAVLHRWTGEQDLVVGSSVSGRTRPEIEHLLGTFNNMIVLRTSLDGRPSLRELVGRVKQVATEGFDRQNLPYEWLVRELRGGGAEPPVTVCFNMPAQDVPLRLVDLPVVPEGAQFELTAHIMPEPDEGLRVQFEYSADLFDESTVRELLDQYLSLIDELLRNPDLPIAQAPMAASVLEGAPAELTGTLPEFVIAQARRTPDAIAVISGADSLTYAELVRRARGTAAALRARGAGPGVPVGVQLARGLELPVAVLGAWLAGAAYVPLDPAQPEARTRLIVAETGALVLDEATHTGVAPDVRVELGDPAYVIYTSGSTGRPKGSVITHAAIANRVLWAVRRYAFGPGDRMLQKTRITFDAHVWEFFAPLVSGGAVVMAPAGVEEDPEAMLRAVADHQVSVLQVVPSVLRLLAEDSLSAGWARCRNLRLLFSAGEPLHAELCQRIFTRRPGIEIVNTYGPTECAIDVSAQDVDPGQTAGPIPIGRPIDGVRLLVLDREGEPAPPWVPGDLYVGGIAVGLGYLGRQDLTAAAFVPDPAGGVGRLYRTGDRARLRGDGALEFLGRRDGQLKINGVRVEPGEVESVLVRHPAVPAATVVAREGNLIAYVTGSVPHDDLRAFLREWLPAPMLPGRFVTLDRLPLNASGKVDRAALPEPGAPAVPSSRLAARDPIEEKIVGIWAEFLGLQTPGVRDDFFALGGHSLLMTRLGLRLRGEFGVEIPLRDLLGATTVEQQAALVGRAKTAGDRIAPVGRDLPLLLSPGQRRLWFLDRMEPGGTLYTVPLAVRLRGRLDSVRLENAITEVARRHEVLRTRYDDGPVQIVMPEPSVPLRHAEAPLFEVLDDELGRPFDLDRGQVMRAVLVRQAEDDHVLVLLLHHIACDGWSLEILLRELGEIYAGGSPELPSIQFGDFAVWQNSERRDGSSLAYWRKKLDGLTPLELPPDRPRLAEWSGRGAVSGFVIPADLAGRLRELGRAHAATPFMTFLAPFLVLLSRYTGSIDTVVGTPLAGRAQPEIEDLIGFFANTLVLRTDLSGDPAFPELLGRVKSTVLEAYAHQELPFERLVEEVGQRRDLSRNPLFQIMFEMGGEQAADSLGFGGLTAERLVEMPWHTAKFDLTMSLLERTDGSVLGYVEYATDLFDAVTMAQLVGRYRRVLEAVAADPALRPSELDVFTGEERRLIGAETDGEERGLVGTESASEERRLIGAETVGEEVAECMHEMFERQAAASPDTLAVVEMDGDRLTYAELDARANALAHGLRRRGVVAETPVHVFLGRGAAMVTAMLATLKAGGVYVPLDVDAPPARMSGLDARFVVTTPELADRARLYAADLVLVGPEVAAEPPAAEVTPGDLAYTIFTSGSTGRPKGVMVDHRAWTGHARAIAREFELKPSDRVLLMSSPAFDVSMEQVAVTLLSGATLVVAAQELTSPARMPALMAEHQVTVAEIPPSYYREMVGHCDEGLAGLRLLSVGSDVVRHDDAGKWFATGLPARFVSGYGPTETTVTCTLARVTAEEVAVRPGADPIPIGRPVGHTRVHVLDAQLNAVPFGVPGELYIGGARLARGYAGRPDLTADRFVPDPFRHGERLYRTGDLVRYREDGSLRFLGRTDNQVKLRGFRIETGEVEAALLGHPQVREAAVVAFGVGDERGLAAYAATRCAPDELREFLTGRLPGYMVPTRWTVLDRLPLTAGGKVDRRALRLIEPSAVRSPGRRPRTPAEERIAGIWASVLDVEGIGIDQDFFALGGHSLRAARVHTRIQEAFGVELPLRRLFEATTIADLAQAVQAAIEDDLALLSDTEIAALLEEEEPSDRHI